jgi:multiple sugar transport system substrate-binding protein
MTRILAKALVAATMMVAAAPAWAVEIEVAYPYSHLFDVTYERIMKSFTKAHPDIKVKFRAAYEKYEDGTNTVLRESVSGNLPDVTMQALNRQAILVEKGIGKSLDPFISKEANFAKEGYHSAMLSLSTFDKKVYGLPFSVSLPVGYYNMDLIRKSGSDKLPTTWDDVVNLCQKMKANGVKTPMFFGWNITGNWLLQAMMWSQGVPIMKGNKFNLGSPEGLTALNTLKKIFNGCGMPNLSVKDAEASFSAGQVGMLFWSTSAVGVIERAKSDFEFKTNEFPGINGGPKALPAGGNAAMLVSATKDPKRLQAAWTFLKFITSGDGAAAVAETTGYMPPNKAANEIILVDFYKRNPNKETAVRQLPLLSDWQAYPGNNGLAVTQVIYDAIESIVVGDKKDMKALQAEVVEEVNDLLPQ